MSVHGPTGKDVHKLIIMSYEVLMHRHPHEVVDFLDDAKDHTAVVKIRGDNVKVRGEQKSALKHFALLHYIDCCASMTRLYDYMNGVQSVIDTTPDVAEAAHSITGLLKSRL